MKAERDTSDCPRCGFPADWNSDRSLVHQQVDACKFCAERFRQMAENRGRAFLEAPTDEFPTWKAPMDKSDSDG